MVASGLEIYKGKRIFLTGHTGFKGSWMTVLCNILGSTVYGYSLEPRSNEIFQLINGGELCNHRIGDVRNFETLMSAIEEANPDIIFHLAAQPLVLESYKDPSETITTNYNGTFNLLEISRTLNLTIPIVVVTTDKVYRNEEMQVSFREGDALGGKDVYSGSKAAAELLTYSYASSFNLNAVTARAGNVIGGGDFSENRIVPDIVGSYLKGEALLIRNPTAVRPWQHALESISGYLAYGSALLQGVGVPAALNFGPSPEDFATVEDLVDEFNKHLGEMKVDKIFEKSDSPAEAHFLTLDSGLAKQSLGWNPKWKMNDAVRNTVEWYLHPDDDKLSITQKQVESYLKLK